MANWLQHFLQPKWCYVCLLHPLPLLFIFNPKKSFLKKFEDNFYQMRLCHPPDGTTRPKYKLLFFITTKFFCKEKNALAFNRDRCCHLVLCLRLIPFLWQQPYIFADYRWRHWNHWISMQTITVLNCHRSLTWYSAEKSNIIKVHIKALTTRKRLF